MRLLGKIDPQPPSGIKYMLGDESWLKPEDRSPLRMHVRVRQEGSREQNRSRHRCAAGDPMTPTREQLQSIARAVAAHASAVSKAGLPHDSEHGIGEYAAILAAALAAPPAAPPADLVALVREYQEAYVECLRHQLRRNPESEAAYERLKKADAAIVAWTPAAPRVPDTPQGCTCEPHPVESTCPEHGWMVADCKRCESGEPHDQHAAPPQGAAPMTIEQRKHAILEAWWDSPDDMARLLDELLSDVGAERQALRAALWNIAGCVVAICDHSPPHHREIACAETSPLVGASREAIQRFGLSNETAQEPPR